MSRRLLVLLSTLSLIVSLAGPAYAATPQAQSAAGAATARAAEKAQLAPADAVALAEDPLQDATEGIFIVRFDAAPLATYRGGVAGLAATSPTVTGAERLDTTTPESRAYTAYLQEAQATFVARLDKAIGHASDVRQTYTNAINGMAVWLTPEEAFQVSKLPGVSSIRPDEIRQLQTDVGPTFIGAPGVWGGTDCSGEGTCGEEVIVGDLDTGINPENPSFASPGPVDGFTYTNPLGSYVGVCDSGEASYDATFPCNDKLIGAWDYTGEGALDNDGHGSHTASTAAGNFVHATVEAPTLTINPDISGVAPHANIIAYKVCNPTGCPSSNTIAALDQAITDGVDVINYSIGSPSPEDPWASDEELAFLSVRAAGIFVSHSAGNEGPAAATVGSPLAPWMMHVAAVTHNRKYVNSLVDMSGGDTTPPADIEGLGFTSGYGPATIVYAGDYPSTETDTPELCGVGNIDDFDSPWPEGTFNGEIVVCDRGTFGRVEKGANVLAAGAGGYILVDNGDGLVGDAHELPAVHISQDDGAVLKAWLASGTDHVGTISGAVKDSSASNGDIMAGFSSRGPNRSVLDMLAPSVAAPGVDIIAANGVDGAVSWGFLSGTSMASPHAAGAAALLVALHPDWTPAEVQSALMTTGTTDVRKEDGTTPADWFDQGSGRIQVDVAADAALVLDESAANFVDADPAEGGDPSSLNLASMANHQCVLECSWTRTVTATADGSWTAAATADDMDLSISPASFSLTAGESQELTITADVTSSPTKVWMFGDVTLSASGLPDTFMPVAVQASTGDLPSLVEIDARRDAGSQVVNDLTAIEITDLTVETAGLTPGTELDLSIPPDSDNDSVWDEINDGTYWMTVDVPAGTWRLVAETYDSEAPDVDLYIGTGDTPSEGTIVCGSATGSNKEYCDVTSPAAGTYWILVQNWAGSGADADAVTLSYALVGPDAGNMLVEGPAQQPQLDPFDARILWDLDGVATGDHLYGAFSVGTDAAHPGNVGSVSVDLDRVADDVTKTVDVATAEPGDTLTFTITVDSNPTPTALHYSIVDHIPDGFTYVPGSASGGLTLRSDGALTWSGTMLPPVAPEWVMTTSATDPYCDTGFGGYVDLEGFGIDANAGISGDGLDFTTFSSMVNTFYGTDYTGVGFTDDGFAYFGAGNGGDQAVPQTLPDADPPNNLAAALWHDLEVVYDADTNTGVSLATAGPTVGIIEYDDLQLAGGSDPIGDFEVVVASLDDTPGYYEIVYAYDNLNLPVLAGDGTTTIGIENADGSQALAYLNNGDPTGAISDGFQVCYDWYSAPRPAQVLTYQVTVDPGTEGTVITNDVTSTVDQPGAKAEIGSVDVAVGDVTPPEFGATDELTADPVLAHTLTLHWPAATDDRGVTGYSIYQDGAHLADVGPSARSYVVDSLDALTEYTFEVTAVDAQNNVSDPLSLDVTTAQDFGDDDFSIFEQDIEWLYSAGITRGCNPPANDMFCPEANLTRGQLAAMLSRGLNLPATSTDYFTDDDGSIFENDINRVAAAGITLGCNPPANDNYCPNDLVTRGEIAAMFDRALSLPSTTTDFFTDDEGSIFEASINRLAAAGITTGCNPPANDNYCPNELLTRGQTAAFFRRALG